jgi:hypothetical protein
VVALVKWDLKPEALADVMETPRVGACAIMRNAFCDKFAARLREDAYRTAFTFRLLK